MITPSIRLRFPAIQFLLLIGFSTSLKSQFRHFIVSDDFGVDKTIQSYVLPLSDEGAIEHARALIEFGPEIGETIVVAKIDKGTDQINRNYAEDGAPFWSWHVTEFLDFADATIEIIDGRPGFIESDVDGWLANTNSSIGFWSFTVTEELPVQPEQFLGQGWWQSSWFGIYNDIGYPWLNHQTLGFLYYSGSGPSDVWLWSERLGYLWTAETLFPFLWSVQKDGWLWYLKGSTEPNLFFNFSTADWEEL